ncbi:hypothetical protein QCA50_008135 [Cerrena zonata]|uniref:Uncharacterized protein n=1 Tax=Cerrena zonata TaxID=2478898 RepID=A0AAW0G848_9APHY
MMDMTSVVQSPIAGLVTSSPIPMEHRSSRLVPDVFKVDFKWKDTREGYEAPFAERVS